MALGVLTALAIYNAVAGRKRDRAEVNDQVSELARGSGDMARQIAEFGRRLSAMEGKVETVVDKAASADRSRSPTRSRSFRGWSGSLPNPSPSMRLRSAAAADRRSCSAAPPAEPRRQLRPARRRAAEPAAAPAVSETAQDRRLRWPRPRRHHCRGPRRHRRPADRSPPAADRDFAAAQGALLRGAVAAQCRERRSGRGRRISCPTPRPVRCCRSSTAFRCCDACRWCGGCCSRTATSACSAIFRRRR